MEGNSWQESFPENVTWQIKVCCTAHLDSWLKDCFDGLRISQKEDGTSIIRGELPDISAVYGLILQLRDAGVFLLSLQVERVKKGKKNIDE